MRYIDTLPRNFETQAASVIKGLRRNDGAPFADLGSRLNRQYVALADVVLDSLVRAPNGPELFGRLGANEEAYGLNIAEFDGAAVRAHFYTGQGIQVVSAGDLASQPVDFVRFGTPHDHRGNISGVSRKGTLVHHLFTPGQGTEYIASRIVPKPNNDLRARYNLFSSGLEPIEEVGLEHTESIGVERDDGYQMNKHSVHVVHWTEPTITVFIGDMLHPNKVTVFQQQGVMQVDDRSRIPPPDEQQAIWESFTALAQSRT